MKKQVIFLGVLLLLVSGAMAYRANYVSIRPNGSYNIPTAHIQQFHSYDDTLNVDTFKSDTFDVGDAEVVNIGMGLTGFAWSDSVLPKDQGVYYIVHTYSGIRGHGKRILYYDTICADGSALDSTAAFTWHNFKTDTVAFQDIWFETIITDSFVSDSGFYDTSDFRFAIDLLWR